MPQLGTLVAMRLRPALLGYMFADTSRTTLLVRRVMILLLAYCGYTTVQAEFRRGSGKMGLV